MENGRMEVLAEMKMIMIDALASEHYLKELYLSRGYAAEVTSASGDYGADLLLKKDGKKIVVQAKRYVKDVGRKTVGTVQVVGVIHIKNHENRRTIPVEMPDMSMLFIMMG
ncbi:restriction endonuclease [Neobacillus sp. BF23-41]|uniref:restriction endonuclease n=1 Tax=Neobacillus sp. BF23-41 TaxID=3240280 RepID=UPI0034E49B6B